MGEAMGSSKMPHDSLELALLYNKRHSNVLRDIARFLERGFRTNGIKLDTYIKRGKAYPSYSLSDEMFEMLCSKYNLRAKGNSLEEEYLQVIADIFPNEEIELQKEFLGGKYRVDMYIPYFNMVIEIYEKEHEYNKEYDSNRKKEIIEEIIKQLKQREYDEGMERDADFDYNSWISFVEIKEGELGQGIREIMLEIERTTWNSPAMYMK